MAYTYEQLTKAYTAVHGVEPTGEAASQLRLLTNVSYTDTQRLSYILNSADQSTSVAVLSYQFFTGKAPSAEGMDYLLKSGEKNLNSETYAKFNLENRFMNFATNLALQGEGKAAFEANYGSMTYAQYVASIYESIIGKAQATAAGLNPEQTILDIIGRQDLILQSARNNGVIGPNATAAEIDLALKAATAAYLLAEGIKADVGVYAGATNNFMVGLATGKANYNTDILTTHAPTPGSDSSGVGNTIDNPPAFEDLPGAPPPPQPEAPQTSFTLTTGDDKFTGTDGDDTFTGTDLTFGGFDTLDGGAGHDTLNITATPGPGQNSYYNLSLPNGTVTGIETVTIDSNGGVNAHIQTWTDVTQLNVTTGYGITSLSAAATTDIDAKVTGQANAAVMIEGGADITLEVTDATTGTISIGTSDRPVGDIVITRETAGAVTAGAITVSGGKTVSVTQTAIDPLSGVQTNSQVNVVGTALTTEVTIKSAQTFNNGAGASRAANSVSINDVNYGSNSLAGTISKVTVDSYTTLAVNSSGLTDLSLAHGSGDVTLRNGNLAAPTNTELNLALNSLTGGVLLDFSSQYRTLNVTTGAQASTVSGLVFGNLQTLDVKGDSTLTIQGSPTLNALQTVSIRDAAGLNADLSNTSVTTIQALGSTGVNTLKIDASKATFIGGAGEDRITLSAATVSQIVNLGDGDDVLTLATGMNINSLTGVINGGAGANTLNLDASSAEQISAMGGSNISNFQTVVLTGVNGQTIDMGMLGGVASTVRVASGNGDLNLTGATALRTLELTGFGVNHNLTGDWSGADDALTVKMSSHTSMTFSSGFTAAGVETVHFVTHDTASSPSAADEAELTWLGDDLTTITVSGNAGLYLQAASSAVTSVDATGLTQGDFTWWGGDLANDITIKGSLTGENGISFNSSKAINYTGGSASDYIGVQNGYDHVISVGAGDDEVSVGWGANKVDVGTGTDTVFLKGGNAAGRTIFTEITGMTGGDMLVVSSIDDRTAATLGAEVTGPTDFDAFLDAAAAGDGSGTALMRWFDFGGDTYVVLDASSHATFQQGQDIVVKLVGGFDLTASTISSSGGGGPGTLHLVDILPI